MNNYKANFNKITKLQDKLDNNDNKMRRLIKLLEMYDKKYQIALKFKRDFPETEQKRLANSLRKYRKAIRIPEDDERSMLQFTKDKFKNTKIQNIRLKEQLAQLQEEFKQLQTHASATKNILETIHIPEFRADLMNMNYEQCFSFTTKLFEKLKRMEFYQETRTDLDMQIEQTKKEIVELTPPLPKFVYKRGKKNSQVSVAPSVEMKGATSYEDAKIKTSMKLIRESLINAKTYPLEYASKLKPIKTNFVKLTKKINQTNIKVQRNSNKMVPHQVKNPEDIRAKAAADFNDLRKLKKSVDVKEKELDQLMFSEFPEMRNMSPEGLLKWKDNLLTQQKKMREEYAEKIKRATNQLRDAKVIKARRINGLKRMLNENK